MTELLLASVIVLLLAGFAGTLGFLAAWRLRRGRSKAAEPATATQVQVESVIEQVRGVGKLVGLEVAAKEIATATQGWNWLPPLLLTQARMAMIFKFERQYWVDLSRIRRGDVEELGDRRYRLHMPPIEGTLRLIGVEPYDIQHGRLLGLIDVVEMNAKRQSELMAAAQAQAASLFEVGGRRYDMEARASIERQLRALLRMMEAEIEIHWLDDASAAPAVQIARPAREVPAAASTADGRVG